ncbi:hypothetical protein BKA69DRAFT_1098012 [Paraphysoderma sedebokerense]|nr:hypothetical protein BKA69DRAFT_1098012 [Paraphysoderma sedebokerense]
MAASTQVYLESTAVVSFLAGMALKTTIALLVNPNLHSLRGNRLVFGAIVVGSISAVCFFICSLYGLLYGLVYTGSAARPIGYWFRAINDFCLYTVLIERLLVVAHHAKFSVGVRRLLNFAIPAVLSVPAIVAATIYSIYPNIFFAPAQIYWSARQSGIALSTIALLSNLLLSVLFLRTLLKNREGNLKSIIMNEKTKWAALAFDFLLTLVVLLLRIVGFSGLVVFPGPIEGFNSNIYPLIILESYKNYVTITKDVAKSILKTQLSVSPQSQTTPARVNPTSVATAAASNIHSST